MHACVTHLTVAAGVKAWIEKVTGDSIGADFQGGLKSGVILCNLINKLKPGTIKSTNSSALAFKQLENIGQFLDSLKVPSRYTVWLIIITCFSCGASRTWTSSSLPISTRAPT